MMWCAQFVSRVSLATTRALIFYNKFSGVSKHVRWPVKLKPKNARKMTCKSDASALQEVASDTDTSPLLPIGIIRTEFLTPTSNVSIPIGQTNETDDIVSNALPHLEAISLCSHFLLETPQKNSKLRAILQCFNPN
jgi:hypothetical protein